MQPIDAATDVRPAIPVAAQGLLAAGSAISAVILAPTNVPMAGFGFLLAATSMAALVVWRHRKSKDTLQLNNAVWLAAGSYLAASQPLLGIATIATAVASGYLVRQCCTEFDIAQPNGQKLTREEPAAAEESGLGLDREGFAISTYNLGDALVQKGERFVDRVHLQDRVAFLTALADVKSGRADSERVELLLNTASPGGGQTFRVAQLLVQPSKVGEVQIQLIEQIEKQVGSGLGSPENSVLTMVSHELRTPLNAIIGFSDLLKSDRNDALLHEKRMEYASLINGAGTHLLALVNTILDVSKIEAGSYSINAEEFSFAQTAAECVAMLKGQADEKSLVVNERYETTQAAAFADRRAVKQILINLLSNAIKFTDQGGVITIDAEVTQSGLKFEVSDTGIGMDEAALAVIGNPFTQFDKSLNREHEGTGLGLSLVKGLVELHNGQFTVHSHRNIGTKVVVTIPNQQDAEVTSGTEITALNSWMDQSKEPRQLISSTEVKRNERKFG